MQEQTVATETNKAGVANSEEISQEELSIMTGGVATITIASGDATRHLDVHQKTAGDQDD